MQQLPHLEVAATFFRRQKGLAGRDPGTTAGMVFLFPFRWRWGIWMRGMRCPLEIIWIDRGRVVGRAHYPLPTSWRERWRIRRPPCPVDMVIELPRTV